VEGIGAPTLRYDALCKVCKTTQGACASCLHCHATFHVGCAHGHNYVFGFDMTPVKASRRDAVPTVTLNGDTGSMVAAIWCKEHAPKALPHPMNEQVEGTDLIALQVFAREFKQADLTLTGTARKANLVDQSTRVVPQAPPTQTNRRASAIATQTPTSTRGRQSNAGLLLKDEASEPPAPKSEHACARCKIEASPRWWKIDAVAQVEPPLHRVVDGPLLVDGSELNGHATVEHKPMLENGQIVNGYADRQMTDAPPATLPQEPLTLNTNIAPVRPASYLCQKCHWKKQNGVEEEEERERSLSVLPEAQQLTLRSPPVQPFVPPPPPALAGSWNVSGGPSMPPNQPPPLPSWHNGAPPPPHSHLPHHLHNGIGHPPPQHGTPVHPPPFHAPYPPTNGYPSYSAPPVHSQMPLAPPRASYAPQSVNGAPTPLHLNNGAMMLNGMHSPHGMQYSPTHPHAHHSSRSSESPYSAAPPAVPQYPIMHHGVPAMGQPSSPRDSIMRDAPPATSAPTERANTGASASPSLRNLLH
jgi:hypothetical protein